jgi:hypothetical protein
MRRHRKDARRPTCDRLKCHLLFFLKSMAQMSSRSRSPVPGMHWSPSNMAARSRSRDRSQPRVRNRVNGVPLAPARLCPPRPPTPPRRRRLATRSSASLSAELAPEAGSPTLSLAPPSTLSNAGSTDLSAARPVDREPEGITEVYLLSELCALWRRLRNLEDNLAEIARDVRWLVRRERR